MTMPIASMTAAPTEDLGIRRELEVALAVNEPKLTTQGRATRDANGDGRGDLVQVTLPGGVQTAQSINVGAGKLGNDGVQRVAGIERRVDEGDRDDDSDAYSKPRAKAKRYRSTHARAAGRKTRS